MLNEHDIMMREEKITKLLVKFALPSMAGMIAGAIYNIVDRIFVGQMVGTVGLAAITTASPAMILMFAASLLFGIGGSSRVAILRGAKKQRMAEQALSQSVLMLAFTGIFAVFLGATCTDTLLRLSGTSETVLPVARTYMKIILFGAPFALISVAFNSLIRACGAPKYAMWTQIIGAATNVVLDAFFIGWMNMGVAGAALGTVIAQSISTMVGLAYFFSGKATVKLRLHFMLRPKLSVLKKIVSVGIAPFLVEFAFVFYITLMNRLIHKYGGDIGLSAVGIFFSIDSLLFLPAFAIGDAAQPLIGYNYGARLIERVIEIIKKALVLVCSVYFVAFCTAELFAEHLVMIFSSDPALMELAVPGLRISYIGLVFFGLPVVTTSTLQGLGLGKQSVMLSAFRQGLFLFPPILILPHFFGMWGIWGAFPVGDVMGAVIAGIFLLRTIKWLRRPPAQPEK